MKVKTCLMYKTDSLGTKQWLLGMDIVTMRKDSAGVSRGWHRMLSFLPLYLIWCPVAVGGEFSVWLDGGYA
jgi:hypothetical protein